ncbi:Hypothetical protein NCS54_01135200 [Fusarium falciforme]|uniref:Hypothetical protein n=1 Tax=Fusarium falciforme TaxID=195108 RepID=UPI002300486C|nr:Hypothetical protein NCS54_01135200 [Fusarium falciforme]WAO93797.1 Hypothetical protein NCS54_01135200 [Fusarium falciforme]
MDSVNWIAPRAEDGSELDTAGFQFQANSTSAWDNQLKLAAAASVRTSIVVLASFNVLAAFATAASIFWESWKTAKRTDAAWTWRTSWFRLIKRRDVHPFVLSCGIVVQGIVYAVAQSKGFQSLMILGCRSISQFMLPALFITPFIQLIFGLELAIRVTKPNIFPARGRWNVVACLIIIGLSLLVTFSITFAIQPPNFCFAGLFWYLHRYNLGCFGLLTTIVLSILIQCGVISFKLHTGSRMSFAVRDEASRMVYYMVIALLSYTLLITFFYNTSFEDPQSASPETMQLSMVVSVVANLSGLLTGCLYLFLRSTKSPSGSYEEDDVNRGFKSDLEGQELEPSTPSSAMPRPLQLPKQIRKENSRETLLAEARDEGKVMGARKDMLNHAFPRPLRLGSMRQSQILPSKPGPARTSAKPSLKNFKKSMYSIFPKEEQPKSPVLLLPTTTYSPTSAKKASTSANLADGLLAPPAIHVPEDGPRRRGSSVVSTATVQIGLRLSNINDMRPSKAPVQEDADKVHNLDCPNSTVTFFPRKTSPLAIAIVDVPGEGTTFQVKDNFEKELPPVPLSAKDNKTQDDQPTLSSAVYSPQRQKPGPFSHNPKSSSVSSRGIHSRQGSRAGPEVRKDQWI